MNGIKFLLVCSFLFVVMSCGKEGPGSEPPINNFDRKAMLASWADNIIIPAYEDYTALVELLNASAQSFVEGPTVENLQQLKVDWLNAYIAWQRVSAFDIGKSEEIGIRNFTNIYPTNAIEIETNISIGSYNLDLPSKFDEQGFPALDYLIFGLGENDDEVLSYYNSPEHIGHANYLRDLTNRLVALSSEVLMDWKTGYRDEFVNNDGTSATASLNKMVNDYLFYYERFLRAGKVGIPAGVFSVNTLPDRIEGFFAKDISKTLFLESLNGVKNFFNGKNYSSALEGESLKSYLNYLQGINGGEDLSTLINIQFDAIETKALTLNENFSEQIIEDNSKMLEVYDELQKNVILLKVDMLQALNITVDFVDADGD